MSEARTWLLLDQQARVDRRAMTMEYIYFLIFIAAISVLMGLIWHFGGLGKNSGNRLFAGQTNLNLNAESVPSRKRTVSGLSEEEKTQVEFQERIDIWQRDHELRRLRFAASAEPPITGTKYTYVPSQQSRVTMSKAEQKRPGTVSNPFRWQLLD